MYPIVFGAFAISMLLIGGCGKKGKEPAESKPAEPTAEATSETPFTPPAFLPADIESILTTSWQHYKTTMIAEDSRPLGDPDKEDIDRDGDTTEKITVSETASYVLLRAAAMGDETAFGRVWQWTSENMQRNNIETVYDRQRKISRPFYPHLKDYLFAMRWVPADGQAGSVVIGSDNYDFNPATDADQDIAAALLVAANKWHKDEYQTEALAILADIWDKEVLILGNDYYLLSGDQQFFTFDPFTGSRTHAINPSYLRPSYYETLFRQADSQHLWKGLTPTAYWQMNETAKATMHDKDKVSVIGDEGIIPDFAAIDDGGRDGRIHDLGFKQGDHSKKRVDYFAGGDAFRINFWMAIQALNQPDDPDVLKYFSQKEAYYIFLKGQLATDKEYFDENGNKI
ncbi:MAG: glycosyl hydrolase family 8, partial [Candidatus Margulisbacteria bacterium]|nr:glycosyl hydrolase family 8 [Candidatus Margulisiibacteriota bacterium]